MKLKTIAVFQNELDLNEAVIDLLRNNTKVSIVSVEMVHSGCGWSYKITFKVTP